MEALSLATGKVDWDTEFSSMPLGAATVSNDLLFTTLYNGVLVALNRSTGAIVYLIDGPPVFHQRRRASVRLGSSGIIVMTRLGCQPVERMPSG